MPAGEDYSIGELIRSIAALRAELAETRRDLSEIRKIETRTAVTEHRIREAHTRIDELDDAQRWAMRLVVGAIVLAVLSLVLGGGLPT